MPRTLTHSQYERLVTYDHGNPSWQNGAPPSSLAALGYLRQMTYDRSLFQLTEAGAAALAAYRAKWGIRV
jgi:hypothetical protein